VYRAPSASGTFAQVGTSAVNYYTDNGLASGNTYYYKVSAVNAAGESALSAAVEGAERHLLTVTELNLSGAVAAPVKDAAPQAAAAALGHSQYAITSLAWQTASGGTVSGAFAAGTVYKAVLGLQAQGAYTFAGLGADAFSFSGADSVTAAVSGQTATVTITFPVVSTAVLSVATAEEFVSRLNWIKANGQPDSFYVLALAADISIGPQTLSASVNAAYRNVTIMLVGQSEERIIMLNANGSLFTLEGYSQANFTFILGDNIRLQGMSGNNAPVVCVNQYAEFIMRGGTISGNTASYSSSSYCGGGGVYVGGGTFTMSGGTISGNTSSSSDYYYYYYGGGVYVDSGTFTKNGNSIIYGNDADAALKNTVTGSNGHAVYVGGSGSKTRNATAYAADTMDSSLSGYAGGWEW
jgi:hypothetical protein